MPTGHMKTKMGQNASNFLTTRNSSRVRAPPGEAPAPLPS